MKTLPIRLTPGQDLRQAIEAAVRSQNCCAAFVLSGIGRPRLSLGEIRALALPIPPACEQRRIDAEVDRRVSLIHGVEAEVVANLKRAERLRQSTLATAFLPNGKVV